MLLAGWVAVDRSLDPSLEFKACDTPKLIANAATKGATSRVALENLFLGTTCLGEPATMGLSEPDLVV